MPISLELDKFCNWFEGEFCNWTQAASNPTKWAHIVVTHKKIGDRKFDTSSRYNYQDKPYRTCLLYTSPSPRDVEESRMPSSA